MRIQSTVFVLLVAASTLGTTSRARAQDDGLPLPTSATATTPAPATPTSTTTDPNDVYGPHPAGTMLATIRQQVVATALGEVGKVSDIGGSNGLKKGWPRLKQYFDEATSWGPDCFAQGLSVRDGIELAGRNPPGGEWCGIFATWCFEQAGVAVSWKWGIGPRPLALHTDRNQVQPGDIGVIAQYSHHFIVVKRDGDRIWTVSGNSTAHGITLDSPRAVSALVGYYRPTEDVWVPDDGTVTPTPGATATTDTSGPSTPASVTPTSATPASTTPATGIAQAVGQTTGDPGASTDPTATGTNPTPTTGASPTSTSTPDSSEPVLRQGASGAAVKRLQGLLVLHGATLAQDGIFGPATKKAVRDFQQSQGCSIDGVVGPETWAALDSNP